MSVTLSKVNYMRSVLAVVRVHRFGIGWTGCFLCYCHAAADVIQQTESRRVDVLGRVWPLQQR